MRSSTLQGIARALIETHDPYRYQGHSQLCSSHCLEGWEERELDTRAVGLGGRVIFVDVAMELNREGGRIRSSKSSLLEEEVEV